MEGGGEEGGELYLCRRNVTELQFKAELVEKKREDFDVDTEGGGKKAACLRGRRAPDMELKIHVVLGVVVVWKEGRNKKVFLVSGPLLSLQGRPINSAVRPMHVPSRAPPSSAP